MGHFRRDRARLLALLIWVDQYQKGEVPQKKLIFKDYISSFPFINNWDLIDSSAPVIVGEHLLSQGDKNLLYKWAKAKNLWSRRIAVLATLAFIRSGEFHETLRLCEILLEDREDLIHKATGWMLREIGKQNLVVLRQFLDKNLSKMPRTMLRYAIEKFPPKLRLQYLKTPST